MEPSLHSRGPPRQVPPLICGHRQRLWTAGCAVATRICPIVRPVRIRQARPEEYDTVGELIVRVYLDGGFIAPDSPYLPELRDVADRVTATEVLVAVDDAGAVLGSVTFCPPGSPYAEITDEGEAEFRMLVVDPAARGRGLGEALVRACIERARALGSPRLRLSTLPLMTAAHRLYERLGFVRTPERDWSPPTVRLLSYALDLR
jgi:ribosomal protein S18 acetylase RimI-like enzyme